MHQAQRLRQIAIGVAMLMAAETAVVAESGGIAFADSTTSASAVSAASDTSHASGPADAQDETSAVLTARLQNRKIEVLSARTTDSTTYALPSGELETEAYAGPVRVKQDGTWKDIDTSLSDTGADLAPQAAAADIAVSDGGDTDLASVTKGKESFGLGWQEKLPTPGVKDNTASYDLGSGQTLSVTALAQGFSENIKLTQQPDGDAVSYRIPLKLDGLKLSQADSGHLLLKNSADDLVAEAPAPMMWDASKDPASGESAHQEQVATKVETASDGSQTLVLTPDKDFLATATYPVTVDPTSTLAVTTDTWVQNPDYTDSQVSSQELKSGTYDGGTDTARSYLKFDVSKFTGKHITSATMSLYNYYSATCSTSGAATDALRITSSWSSSSITWGAQPSTTTTGMASNTGHWGYTGCAANWSNWNLQSITQAWANGSANYGIQVRADSESDSSTWRRFRSANYTTSGYAPKLVVTYNSYPTTNSLAISPNSVNAYNGKRYVTTYTPTLSAKVTDADGSTVKGQFEITNDPAYSGETSYSYTGTSPSVASGSTATLAIPSASQLAGAHLRMRVRGYDGTDYGSWSSYNYFVPNVAKPTAPNILCDPYTAQTWTGKADNGATCTLDTSSSDGMGYYWGLDDSSVPNRVYDTTDGNGGDPLTITIKPGEDWHKLYAKTIDSGGNVSSAATEYDFGVGGGVGLLTPSDGDTTAHTVSLTSTGKTMYTGVTYQYRRGEMDSWTNIPTADVTKSSGSPAISAWPVVMSNGSPAALTWSVTNSFSQDGSIDIRAAFTDGSTTIYSQPHTVTVDRDTDIAPSVDIGPGSLNTLTGDFTLSVTDASGFGLSVSRTASSRHPAAGTDAPGQTAIFGPQWTSGVSAGTADSDWVYLKQTSFTSVAVIDADGGEIGFTAASGGGWKASPGWGDMTLTSVNSAGTTTNDPTAISVFTLKDDGGTTTTFVKVGAAATWQVSQSSQPTEDSTTEVFSEQDPNSSASNPLTRPKYIIAPTSAVSASTCKATPATAGCRVLEFVYATSTNATSSVFGNYVGHVSQIKEWSTDKGATTATATVVAQYAYDDAGRLRQEWDPRISSPLKTVYSYDSAGRVATAAAPGELPWTFTYDNVGSSAVAGPGMLVSASHPNLKQGTKSDTDGTATTSVVYNVPVSGAQAPNAMSASDIAAWGQTDVPTDATAIFPADSVPQSDTGSSLAAADYRRATITYMDASGREVNTATPGGHIDLTAYDRFGNTVRQLTAANRELALGATDAQQAELALLDIGQETAADRAEQLSTTTVYTSDGLQETDELGPVHLVTLASVLKAGSGGTDVPTGTSIPARQHVTTSYDEGRPTNGSATVTNRVTTTKTGARVTGYPSDADVRTVTTAYDWAKGLPTTTVTDPGGLAITKTTTYDVQGRVATARQPKSNGTDADTTVTTYYSATGSGTCNGHPEWADLVCTTAPAGAIANGGSNPSQLPTKTYEYDRWGNTTKLSESVGGVTRTTTTSYDNAGRTLTTAISGGAGTSVPNVTTTYDPDTGHVATVTSNGQTISHTYDALGREITYNDGTGNTTTTAYDALDRVVKTTDSAPSTTTYTYNTSQDPRGLETSRTDSVAGTFNATYDANGDLATQSLPGGYTVTVNQDETGAQTARTYTRDSDGTIVAADSIDSDVQGEAVTDTNTNGQTRARSYSYDAAGRLSRTDDTNPDGACTRRDYTLDNNTNRTALATSTSDVGASCTSTGATTASYSYDSADRLITAGTVYDTFGRTATQASGATIAYYVNDLVRQQTTNGLRQTWGLDPTWRLASWTTETQGSDGTWTQTSAKTSHYGCGCDSPTWTAEDSSGTITRNVQGIDGSLNAETSASGDTVLQLTDLQGDVTVQLPLDASKAVIAQAYDEYGTPEDSTASARYGWLGGQQRSTDTVTGAVLMGVRLYDTTAGRFLSRDPVTGGNCNAYEYTCADPVNSTDLSGKYIDPTPALPRCRSFVDYLGNNYKTQVKLKHNSSGGFIVRFDMWGPKSNYKQHVSGEKIRIWVLSSAMSQPASGRNKATAYWHSHTQIGNAKKGQIINFSGVASAYGYDWEGTWESGAVFSHACRIE
ncbi:DNRLRE domain-containing protein [Streptomyces pseudovenezuelae]|uniref:DNRLRE domain-containing protein n=1 Tax=Streptomyces pseudovenezuelae TaxID=67350 RepID=UPI003812AA8A